MWPAFCAAGEGFSTGSVAFAVATVAGSLAGGFFWAAFGEEVFSAGFLAADAFADAFFAEGFLSDGFFTEGLATSSPFVDFSPACHDQRAARQCLAARGRKSSLRNRSVHARIISKRRTECG